MYVRDKTVGLGLRIVAYLIDFVCIPLIVYFLIIFIFGENYILTYLLGFIALFGYPLIKDGLPNGQSLGKRIFNIKVLNYENKSEPCSIGKSFVRNIVLFIPIVWVVEVVKIEENAEHRRWGDYLAKTIVVKLDKNKKIKQEYVCDYCDKGFSTKEEDDKHEQECKRGKKKLKKIDFLCSKCKSKVSEDDIKCPKCKNFLAKEGAIIKKEH